MNKHALLISIRPRFAQMIFDGTKTVELRRVCPKVAKGDLALVYVSSPIRELQGAFEIDHIISASPATIWKKFGKKTGVKRSEFYAYLTGKKIAHALVIKKAWKLPISIKLAILRLKHGGFRPPQSFQYTKRMGFSLALGINDAVTQN